MAIIAPSLTELYVAATNLTTGKLTTIVNDNLPLLKLLDVSECSNLSGSKLRKLLSSNLNFLGNFVLNGL